MRMPDVIELEHPIATHAELATLSTDLERELAEYSRQMANPAFGLRHVSDEVIARVTRTIPTQVDEQFAAPYFIRDDNKTPLGMVELTYHKDTYADVHYGIMTEARNKGIAGVALRAVLGRGKTDWGLEHVSFTIASNNIPSQALVRSIGAELSPLKDYAISCGGYTVIEQTWRKRL